MLPDPDAPDPAVVLPMVPPTRGPTRYWSETSPINAPIPRDPVLDPHSASIAEWLGSAPTKLSIVAYGAPIYRATKTTPRVTVGPPGSGGGLEVANIGAWGPNPFAGLTVPLDPAWAGSPGYPGETWRDGAAAIVDVDGRVFSLFQLVPGIPARTPARITWGGWQWARPTDVTITDQPGGSATGAGFSRLAGVVTRDELAAGHIGHALVFASKFVRPSEFRFPAKKTDGAYLFNKGAATPANSIAEGQRVQLNPLIDLTRVAGLTPAELAVGTALQTHGAYAIDNGGGAPFQIICETPEPSRFVNTGRYSYAITDPAYVAAGVTTDAPALSRLPLAAGLRVLKNWNGAA